MSSNDYLEIRREGKQYIISNKCADVCDNNEGRELKRTTSLKKAIQWANEYQQGDMPAEYGIHFSNI